MSLRRRARLVGAFAFFLGACTPATPAPSPTAAPTAPPIVPSTLPAASPTPSATVYTIWMPPLLSPTASTPAGELLARRLADYEAAHPGLRLEVRLRDPSGPAGLLETLRLASAAAPAARPDLIVLSAGGVATAATEGLIQPYPEAIPLGAGAGWYPFALAPTSIDGTVFAVPSVSQTEVLAYNSALFARPPASWSEVVGSAAPFLFPAADPMAHFVLAQYLSLGGALTQTDGSPAIDPATLEEVLTFVGSAYSAGTLPLVSRQHDQPAQTWTALFEGRAASAVAPLSTWMTRAPQGLAAVALPTRDGAGVALTRTWSWAVVEEDETRQEVLADVVAWLTDPSFLGPWAKALGTLPPNAASLDLWPQDRGTALARQIVAVAQPMPAPGLVEVIGPALRRAVDAVLTGTLAPQQAALAAATEVAGR